MKQSQFEEIYNLEQIISEAVHKLVDELTDGVDNDVDYEVRQRLTETFRFWRR